MPWGMDKVGSNRHRDARRHEKAGRNRLADGSASCTHHNLLTLLTAIMALLLPQPATAMEASMALGYECTPEGSALSTSARRPTGLWQAKTLYGEAKQEPSSSCTPASSTPLNPRFFPSSVLPRAARRKARPENTLLGVAQCAEASIQGAPDEHEPGGRTPTASGAKPWRMGKRRETGREK